MKQGVVVLLSHPTGAIPMKPFLLSVMILTLAFPLHAQSPVKKDLLKVLKEIPAPATTAAEAFAGCTCDEMARASSCSAERLFAGVEGQLKEVEDLYKAQEASVRAALPPGMNPEAARMAQDPEMKKKMKSMSKEERMKLALSMMGSGPAGTPTVKSEPPEVQAVLAEWQKLTADVLPEYNRGVAAQDAIRAEAEADQKAHDEIGAWEAESIAKLPKISSGEMSAPDPGKVKAVRVKAADRHIALADKRLATFRKEWSASRDHIQSRYGAFCAKLVDAEYARTSPNPSTLKILSDGQMIVLKEVAVCAKRSRDAYESAAGWVALRKSVEKE
jgi:hypothetical protein